MLHRAMHIPTVVEQAIRDIFNLLPWILVEMHANVVRDLENGAFFIRPDVVRLSDHSFVHDNIERVRDVRHISARWRCTNA